MPTVWATFVELYKCCPFLNLYKTFCGWWEKGGASVKKKIMGKSKWDYEKAVAVCG